MANAIRQEDPDYLQVVRGDKVIKYARTNRGFETLKRKGYYPQSAVDLKELQGKRVLDVGTGEEGLFVSDLRARGVEAYGLDISLSPKLKLKPYFKEADAVHTGYDSASFDVVYSNFAIFSYEVGNAQLMKDALGEMSRILKPGGKLRLGSVNGKALLERVNQLPDFKLIHSRMAETDELFEDYLEFEKVSAGH